MKTKVFQVVHVVIPNYLPDAIIDKPENILQPRSQIDIELHVKEVEKKRTLVRKRKTVDII